jgi:Flp pilus assembly protein TadG
MPVLAMLLLGTLTAGFALNQKQQVTHATREGARYAATVAPTQTFSSGTWAENVRTLVVERSAGDLITDQVCVSLVSGSPGVVVPPVSDHSTSGAPCIANQSYPTTSFDTGVRIQVTGTREVKIEFMVSNITRTLSAKATAKSEAAS